MTAGHIVSCGLHLALIWVILRPAHPRSENRREERKITKLFFPASQLAEDKPMSDRKRGGLELKRRTKSDRQTLAKVDLALVELTIEDDAGRDMIAVLKRYGGWVVFVDPGSHGVWKAFRAGSWSVAAGVSAAEGLPILLRQPEWWPEVGNLAPQAPHEALVCALFPSTFQDALVKAIQSKAAELGVREVRHVSVAFSAASRSGLVIRGIG